VILEIATLRVRTGDQAAFEAAFDKAQRLLPGIDGYASHELRGSLECAQTYVLLTEWHAIEDVTLGFRKSADFARWHQLLASFVERPPQIDYFGPEIPRNDRATKLGNSVD